MKYIILLVVLGVFLPMILGLFRKPWNKAKPIVEYAQKRGYRLVNPSLSQVLDSSLLETLKNPALRNLTDASSDIADIEALGRGKGDVLAFTCNLQSKEVTIFNYSRSTQRADTSGGSVPYKVAKIKAGGLPQLSVGKKSIVHTVEDVVGKITGKPEPAINVDARQYPEFSAHYWIRGSDAAAVTAFLSPEKIQFVEAAKLEGTIATNANFLVYFEDGTLRNEKDFDTFIGTVEKLVANLL